MVSGLVTSPCDQLRIFSGDARLMRIASKSAIGFAMSKGLERYKIFLHSCGGSPPRRLPNHLATDWLSVAGYLSTRLLKSITTEPRFFQILSGLIVASEPIH